MSIYHEGTRSLLSQIAAWFYISMHMNIPIIADQKIPKTFSIEKTLTQQRVQSRLRPPNAITNQNWVLSLCITSHHLGGAKLAMLELSVSFFFSSAPPTPLKGISCPISNERSNHCPSLLKQFPYFKAIILPLFLPR